MPKNDQIDDWVRKIQTRYVNYLRSLFYFRDANLRQSFQEALASGDGLIKGPIPEPARSFVKGATPAKLLEEVLPDVGHDGLLPALAQERLYLHQASAIRAGVLRNENYVVATGTASGKTESFLYSILCELYRQHQSGALSEPGVRALILYPMNALANDQRKRLGELCKILKDEGSSFQPTFGQYTGHTPRNEKDRRRSPPEQRGPTELIYREDMLKTPPHILLTNYSMLEYMLIRPDESPLFDGGNGKHWQFIVLDEAHQYRGTRGMEMGMLVRRLKHRIRDGGRKSSFTCIATSATIASGDGLEDQQAVAEFAQELFGEPFLADNVFFGKTDEPEGGESEDGSVADAKRHHLFVRALEGAFLLHENGADKVVINRKESESSGEGGQPAVPMEIALCRECGQHYYVGRIVNGKLVEAIRDPSSNDFEVKFFLPSDQEVDDAKKKVLCRVCGAIGDEKLDCQCNAQILVWECEPDENNPDELKECGSCGYSRGGIGDPVQEIIHGSDGPSAVIATALHELLPEDRRKVLAFADSRQDAAFFAWYAEDSYHKISGRNLIYRALELDDIDEGGLSLKGLRGRLMQVLEEADVFDEDEQPEDRLRKANEIIFSEALTVERRLSLEGVGLMTWTVALPSALDSAGILGGSPWNLSESDARLLTSHLLNEMRARQAMTIPKGKGAPEWEEISAYSRRYFTLEDPAARYGVHQWGHKASTSVQHYLSRIAQANGIDKEQAVELSHRLMEDLWNQLRDIDEGHGVKPENMVLRKSDGGRFQLNHEKLRVCKPEQDELFKCNTCGAITMINIRDVCQRRRCRGTLEPLDQDGLVDNHYRQLYKLECLPATYCAEEHTAQIENEEARKRQERFEHGGINLLSSSTTFEVGVDLGELEVAFLRNVPPESFNYTQRVGRVGRRDDAVGLAVTYCRRSPHDLYHFEQPEQRIIHGKVQPPRFKVKNKKIIQRHMVAVALSAFFREDQNKERFNTVETFLVDLNNPQAARDLEGFCRGNSSLHEALRQVVPPEAEEKVGLEKHTWIDDCFGPDSNLFIAEQDVKSEFTDLDKRWKELHKKEGDGGGLSREEERLKKRIKFRMNTIAREETITFLSRRAIIPKYGFPVDVVELNTRRTGGQDAHVLLQRQLSQAIAEYAPGTKVVANKLEWQSAGIRLLPEKSPPVEYYVRDGARGFSKVPREDVDETKHKRYLEPRFGFVSPLEGPSTPKRRGERLYTTRPFFCGFSVEEGQPEPIESERCGVRITKACPGNLVILCEGRRGKPFFLCMTCGAHFPGRKAKHESPLGTKCTGTLGGYYYGHELVTDVVKVQFPRVTTQWEAYSLGYALLLGAAEVLNVPGTDLNVTTSHEEGDLVAVVLYDNVPGGAELVAQLEREDILKAVLSEATNRVSGGCGCDSSCYGCLRSYRNQFAHPHLRRDKALDRLQEILP